MAGVAVYSLIFAMAWYCPHCRLGQSDPFSSSCRQCGTPRPQLPAAGPWPAPQAPVPYAAFGQRAFPPAGDIGSAPLIPRDHVFQGTVANFAFTGDSGRMGYEGNGFISCPQVSSLLGIRDVFFLVSTLQPPLEAPESRASYEGFNLRRDVYMRMAVWVRSLNLQTGTRWVLVLPPWSHLYHWQNRVLYQAELQTNLRRSLRPLLRPSPGCKHLCHI